MINCDILIFVLSRINFLFCIDYCANAPCENGANCTAGELGYNCSCVTGYTGKNCSIGMLSLVIILLNILCNI